MLKIFLKTPWFYTPVFGSKRHKVKEGIIWSEAESIARAMNVKWNQFVIDRLTICEDVLLKQQQDDIVLEKSQENGRS